MQLIVQEDMSLEEFQDGCRGCHLGYRNGTIIAILNLYVTLMLPNKFGLNPAYGLGGWEDMSFEEFQDGRMVAILDIRTERF